MYQYIFITNNSGQYKSEIIPSINFFEAVTKKIKEHLSTISIAGDTVLDEIQIDMDADKLKDLVEYTIYQLAVDIKIGKIEICRINPKTLEIVRFTGDVIRTSTALNDEI